MRLGGDFISHDLPSVDNAVMGTSVFGSHSAM
ncbi:MAG: hypothetical protein RL648_539, partial [Verrucomicrobiota bacterium]